MDWSTSHRPYPPPQSQWLQFQRWQDLLFAHWPLPFDVLREKVPASLPLDTFEGQAWIGISPFRLSGLRPAGFIALPVVSNFHEVNVRTYVTLDGRPGVYFFSLDTSSLLAVLGARLFFHLPYYSALMTSYSEGDWIRYSSERIHPAAPAAGLRVRYRPTGSVFHALPGTLEYFLTERYCLYAVDSQQGIHRTEIHHGPWPLQAAEAEFRRNSLADAPGIRLPDVPPLLHFARVQEMVGWGSRRIA